MRVLAGFGAPNGCLFLIVLLVFSKNRDAIFPVPVPPALLPCAVVFLTTQAIININLQQASLSQKEKKNNRPQKSAANFPYNTCAVTPPLNPGDPTDFHVLFDKPKSRVVGA